MSLSPPVDRADPADLLAPGSPRLAELLAEIGAEAAVRERERIAPYAQIDLLRAARFGALRVPREYGGAGATLRETFRLIMAPMPWRAGSRSASAASTCPTTRPRARSATSSTAPSRSCSGAG